MLSLKERKCKKEGYSSCKEKECIKEGYNSCEEKNNSIEHFSNNEMECSCKCKKN